MSNTINRRIDPAALQWAAQIAARPEAINNPKIKVREELSTVSHLAERSPSISDATKKRVTGALITLRQVKDLIDNTREALTDPVSASKYKGRERLLETVKETVTDLIKHAKANGQPIFVQGHPQNRQGRVSAYVKNNLAYESSRSTPESPEVRQAFHFADAQLSNVIAQLGSANLNPESSSDTLALASKTLDAVALRFRHTLSTPSHEPMPLNGIEKMAS